MDIIKTRSGLGMAYDLPKFSTVKELNKTLHALYADKNYYVFFYGEKYFYEMVDNILESWLQHEYKCPNTPEYFHSSEFHRICWEIDNDYSCS